MRSNEAEKKSEFIGSVAFGQKVPRVRLSLFPSIERFRLEDIFRLGVILKRR
jgi:hypothetical protein